MRKIYTFAGLMLSGLAFAQAGAPAPYYNGFNWTQTGMALKSALSTKITNTHTNTLSYNEAEEALRIVDLDPADASHNNVLLLYGFSNNICPSGSADDNDHRRRNKESDGGGSNCQWNREHTYAKSLGNPDLGESGPGADAHHLRAADVQRNGDRGSEKFAAGSGNSHDVTSQTWYPGDEWKGDVARMMMYMYLRYGNRCLPKNVGVGTTTATDSNMIDLFLQWNAEDPVTAYEDQRNTYLGNANNNYGQGNRNPFIDNPYLATVIWGGPVAENRWPNVFLSTDSFELAAGIVLYPNPATNGRVNIESAVALESIEVVNLNGQIVKQASHPVASGNVYTLEDLPQGFYLVRLSAQNQTATKKIIVH
ncbi:endonuclease [Flavobacterium caeni]|uniref:Por secretion system C-terminal sorting domain-containing protein n=1 Tax=Flavobacterium caeni TaxID=490189 RepID=A0A1G5CBR0_9FLAO|nr:endonuclease [Flavobacterium caeni]SCX99905.1 Por secretion system C-terminal sorting domain-containing protein [Flavobacterium caeni]